MRTTIIVAAIFLFGGTAAFFCGEWGPGIGKAGVVNVLISACGMALFGISLLMFGIIFATSYIRQFSHLATDKKRDTLERLGRQTLTAVLNVLVYGGLFIVAMGGIAALDADTIGTTIVVIGVWGCCIAAFVLYRRYRKTHKTHYDLFSSVAITLLLLLLGIGVLVGSTLDTSRAAQDLKDEPAEADVFLVDAKIDYPNWRYARIIQAHHILTFFTPDEERIVLEVPENDVNSAKVINELGNFVHLTYYPNTQVFCNAELWNGGRQIMGNDLLDRLNEEYDFEL